jgi:hypothetical protein
MNNDARVVLWGRTIGAVTWLEDREIGVFQYAPDFVNSVSQKTHRFQFFHQFVLVQRG